MTPRVYNGDELTVPGFYWWLPEFAKKESHLKQNWQVISWHPKDTYGPKKGQFVGPLEAPVFNYSEILK